VAIDIFSKTEVRHGYTAFKYRMNSVKWCAAYGCLAMEERRTLMSSCIVSFINETRETDKTEGKK
jgi:hypothetical protein